VRWGDLARPFAVVFAAIFQVYASYVGGQETGEIAQRYRSLVLPATWAFAIWGPIFVLCGLYAIYQALPARREDPVLRAIGWWMAGAFLANGVWIYVYASRQFVLAQLVIFLGFLLAGGAFIRFTRATPAARAVPVDTVLIGPTLGLLCGWLTAANVAGLGGTLVAQGFAPTGSGAAIWGAALLLLGGAVGVFVIVWNKSGPPAAWIAYGAAVVWALAAVATEQWSASPLTAGAAVLSAGLVLAALLGPWGGGRARPRGVAPA
jgi:hypothetical protein